MTEEPVPKQATQTNLTGTAPIEFTVISEPWTKYKLEDGTKLFLKLVVSKVIRGFNEIGQPTYNMTGQNVLSTHAPDHLRGQPTATPINFADPSSFRAVASLEFENIGQEKWNEYHLADGTILKARLEIQSIVRTDKYAADGDPVYLTSTTQPLVRFKISEQLLKNIRNPVRRPEPKAPYG